MIVVSDTSPLRALQALDLLFVVERLHGVALVPPGVAAELAVDVPGLGPIRLTEHPFLQVASAKDWALVERLKVRLGAGESEALALAVETHADLVLLDEADARAAAFALGLRTRGVLAMLVGAKRAGIVDLVAPLIDRLEARIRFRLSREVRAVVLKSAGE